MGKQHAALVGNENHAITANPNETGASYANIAARDADSSFHGTAANVNKVVRVESPLSLWALMAVTPTWLEVSSTATDSFIEHADTFATYTGQAGKVLQVNSGETAVEVGQPLRTTDSPSFAGLTAVGVANPIAFSTTTAAISLTSTSGTIDLKTLGADTVPVYSTESAGTNGAKIDQRVGTQNPEGNVTGEPGDSYYRVSGVNSGHFIHKGATSGNTGWVDQTTGNVTGSSLTDNALIRGDGGQAVDVSGLTVDSAGTSLTIPAGLVVDTDTLIVDATNDRVTIGQAATGLTDLTIFQGSNNLKGLTFSGVGISGTSTTEGVSIFAGNIGAGNNQFWIVNTADLGNSAKNSFRFLTGQDVPLIVGVNNTNTVNKNLCFGVNALGAGAAFGFPTNAAQGDVDAKVHISTGVASEVGLITQGVTSQTADLFQAKNIGDTVMFAIASDGALKDSSGDKGTSGQVLSSTATGTNWVSVVADHVTKVGTPVDNQLAVWTGDGTLEGDADLVFGGATLRIGPVPATVTSDSPLNLVQNTSASTTDVIQRWTWQPGGTIWGLRLDQRHTGTKINYDFVIRDGTTSDVDALSINSNGFIGIGKKVPSVQLDVVGTIRATANMAANDGTELLPAYTFVSDPDTGMRRVSADVLGFSVGGSEALQLSSNLLTLQGSSAAVTFRISDPFIPIFQMREEDGGSAQQFWNMQVDNAQLDWATANDAGGFGTSFFAVKRGATNISFITLNTPLLNLTDTQFPNQVRLKSGGTGFKIETSAGEAIEISSLNTTFKGAQLFNTDGTELLPAYSFTSDPDTGMRRVSADLLGFSAKGFDVLQLTATTTATNFLKITAQDNDIGGDDGTPILLEAGSEVDDCTLTIRGKGVGQVLINDLNGGVEIGKQQTYGSGVLIVQVSDPAVGIGVASFGLVDGEVLQLRALNANWDKTKLQIQAPNDSQKLFLGINQSDTNNGEAFLTTEGSELVFNTSAGEVARFSGLDMGLGITLPTERFHMGSTVTGTPNILRIEHTLTSNSDETQGIHLFKNVSGSLQGFTIEQHGLFDGDSALRFSGRFGGGGDTTLMTLEKGGNLGVGISLDPATKLHVASSGADTVAIITTESTGTNGGASKTFIGDRAAEGNITGLPGDLHVRVNDALSELSVLKRSGSGNTGWRQFATHATNTVDIYDTSDWGTLETAPDGEQRVKLANATTYRIHADHTIPLMWMPEIPTPEQFAIIDFRFVNSSILLFCEAGDTAGAPAQIWGRNMGALLVQEGNFVDTANSDAGLVTTLFDLVGVDANSLLALQFTLIFGFKACGQTVDVFHDHTDSLFQDNVGGFVVRQTAAVASDNLVRAVTFRHSVGVAFDKPVYTFLGSPNTNQIVNSTIDLLPNQDFLCLDSALVSASEIVANPYPGPAKGDFFSVSTPIAITTQAADDTAFASVEVGAAGFSVIVFATIQDFTRGQTVLVDGDVGSTYDGLQVITAVSDDQKSFTINVTFVATDSGFFRMVQHTVASHPFVRDATIVITDTTNNGTFALLRETDTTFNTPALFAAGDLVGTATSNPLNESNVGVKTLSNGAQEDSLALGAMQALDNTAETVISTIDEWVDLNLDGLAAVSSNNSRWTLTDTTTGEMRYEDVNPISPTELSIISASSAGGSQEFEFRAVVNGSPTADAGKASVQIGTETIAIPLQAGLGVVQNDLVRIQTRNIEGTSNIVIKNLTSQKKI